MTETADNAAYSSRAFFVLLNLIFLVTTMHILETLSKIMEEQKSSIILVKNIIFSKSYFDSQSPKENIGE